MGIRFLKIAVVYLFIGATLGLFMGITQKFVLAQGRAAVEALESGKLGAPVSHRMTCPHTRADP